MSVTLTESAARHVTRYLSKRGKGVGVRLGVKTTGCSGLAYKIEYADEVLPEDMVFQSLGIQVLIEYADEVLPEDMVFQSLGIQVLIDPKSLPYLDGTQLDFVREGLNEGFKFHNPNEKDRCGCGESFRI